MKDRREELIELVVSTQRFGNSYPAHHERANRENNQRAKHDPRTLVHMFTVSIVSTMSTSMSRSLHSRMVANVSRRRTRRMHSAGWLFVFVVNRLAPLTEERHEPQAEHIERRHSGSDPADKPEDPASVRFVGKSLPQNFVFREETAERRESGDGEGCNRHRPERPRDQLP